jgi:hypothetical protein
MFAKKTVREYSFLSKDVQPPFSLNTTDVCFSGNKIGSVSSTEKLSNKKGSLYTAMFTSPVEIKNNSIYYNNLKFAEIIEEKESFGFDKNAPSLFDRKKDEKTKHRLVWSAPTIEKQEDYSSTTQPLLDRINKKIKDWDYDELFDLYDKICNMK